MHILTVARVLFTKKLTITMKLSTMKLSTMKLSTMKLSTITKSQRISNV
jgi:hypothetical protein